MKGQILKKWPQALISSLPIVKKILGQADNDSDSLGTALVDALTGAQEQSSQLVHIDYEKARNMANLLYDLNGKPQVLILDALEQLEHPQEQGKLIEECVLSLFRQQDDKWPPFHVFVSIRSPGDQSSSSEIAALEWARKISKLASCDYYSLPAWHPTDEEWAILANYLNKQIPGFHHLVGASDNYGEWLTLPGMVENLLIQKPTDETTLNQALDECLGRTYEQLETALQDLANENSDLFDLAIQILSLPEFSEADWEFVSNTCFEESQLDLEKLVRMKILQSNIPMPSFGHTTRYQYGRDLCIRDWSALSAHQAEELIVRLFAAVKNMEPENAILLICASKACDFLDQQSETSLFIRGLSTSLLGGKFQLLPTEISKFRNKYGEECNFLLGASVVNALIQYGNAQEWQILKQLLQELRTLSAAHPKNEEVHIQFLSSLMRALSYTETDSEKDEAGERLRELMEYLEKGLKSSYPRIKLFCEEFVEHMNRQEDDKTSES